MTFECVKCRRGPRTSQIPSSGSRQPDSSQSKILPRQAPGGIGGLETLAARLVQRVDDLAVDVELALVRRAVADADRLRALVAAEPGKLELREPALAGDAVHDLEVLGRARDRAEEPVTPGACLLDVSGADEREQRQGRVAKPAEAVVPVPHAADPLGQRRRRRRDDSAGRRIRERLQRQKRAMHRVVPATLVRAPRGPVLPERDRVHERLLRLDRLGWRLVGGEPAKDEGDAVAFGDGERRHRAQIAALVLDRSAEEHARRGRRWRGASRRASRTQGTIEP